jgi:AGCS family alanine or glycine:cation symporter
VFSNESGLGSSPIAAAAAQTKNPVTQALVSMTQTFIDTILVCSITGFTIIATGVWTTGKTGDQLTTAAFSKGLPGDQRRPDRRHRPHSLRILHTIGLELLRREIR